MFDKSTKDDSKKRLYKKSNTNGRKLTQEYENPIDNTMLMMADLLAPQFKKMNYTPNGITTLSLIFSAVAMYHLYNHELIPFTVYMLLAHFFDDMDGYYARRYKMVSEEGDKYDHFKDLLLVVASIYILYCRYDLMNFPVLILVFSVFAVLGLMFIGCQETLAESNDKSQTLSFTNFLSPKKENCNKYIKYLRYFGPGTLIVVFILGAWYLDSQLPDSDVAEFSGTVSGDQNIVDVSRPFYYSGVPDVHQLMLYHQPSSSYGF